MKVVSKDESVIVENIEDFDLAQTLECGQCFRFYRLEEEEYIVVAKGRMLHIQQIEHKLIFYNTTLNEYYDIWESYFDLKRDYAAIKKHLLKYDEKLKEAIETKNGVRLLRQDFFETLISFIVSQNKQIPHIKKIVEQISEKYGEVLGEYSGKTYYSFPDVKQLSKATEADFAELKTGFRARYLVDAVKKVNEGTINEGELRNMSEQEAEESLEQIKGVGSKVANCVLLFGLEKRQAFPVDVWIKRIMESLYFDGDTNKDKIKKFAMDHFGEYGGYAQQYLFYYARDNKK